MKIVEISKMYSISVGTLCYYERMGLIVNITSNKSGIIKF